MTDQLIGAHNGLHSEQGSLSGEHPGRSANPVIKVHDVVWLEFEKPDLNKAEEFGLAVEFRQTTTICIERPVGSGSAVDLIGQAPNPFLAGVGLRIDPAPVHRPWPGDAPHYG